MILLLRCLPEVGSGANLSLGPVDDDAPPPPPLTLVAAEELRLCASPLASVVDAEVEAEAVDTLELRLDLLLLLLPPLPSEDRMLPFGTGSLLEGLPRGLSRIPPRETGELPGSATAGLGGMRSDFERVGRLIVGWWKRTEVGRG